MRHLGMVTAVAVVVAMIAPAQAQPFADVPPTHWAYDALAELAAKGLIEGFPDGTFKGDRAVTRYEMAKVVARFLARIASIQVPAAPPAPGRPEVTRTDVASIQRLVNEFRAELAALGVRVTAVEEELNAIKSKLSNVRATGAWRLRYEVRRLASGGAIPGNGNPQAKATDASANAQVPRAIEVGKLEFDGSVAPDVHLIAAIISAFVTFNSSAFGPTNPNALTLATIDNLFFDWRNPFGSPVEIWVGRFGGGAKPGTGIGKTYPVQFGPYGLVMNTASFAWRDSTFDSGANMVDGLRVAGRFSDLADLQVQAVALRVNGGTGSTSYFSGEDAFGVDANIRVPGFSGLRVGGYYVWNTITGNPPQPAGAGTGFPLLSSSNFHVYGPGGGAQNPATTNCPAVAAAVTVPAGGGITCPALGTGVGGYLGWEVSTGIRLDGEYAQWTDSVLNTSDTGYQANVTVDLGTLTGWGHNLSFSAGYLNYGVNFYPPYGNTEMDRFGNEFLYPGNGQGFLASATVTPIDKWTVFAMYFSGNNISNGQTLLEYQAGVAYAFAPRSRITFLVRDERINSIQQDLLYRAQMDYTF